MTKGNKFTKRLLSIALSVIMTISLVNISPIVTKAEEGTIATDANAVTDNNTVADWKFGHNGVKSGSIADGDLVIEDQSGNNNDLKMQLYSGKQLTTDTSAADWTKYLSFEDNAMITSGDGSMEFNGNNTDGIGADFVTVDNADINSNMFENGYTIEFLFYFPEDWTTSDQWMGLMARQVDSTSNVNSMAEPQLGSTSIAVSNCKEIQFLTAPANDNETMSSAAWSVTMDKGGLWYHIAITSDGNTIRTYINGCEAFRDYASSGMDGLFADANDGRFRIGSSWWKEGTQTLDKFLQGNLEEVRISSTALDKSNWLITNPEQYVGEYGNNDSYSLEDENNYNFVFIPDTQNAVKFKTTVMDTAIDELIRTADELNVAGVVHLGDIVENNNDGTQYNNARAIFYQMPEAGIKFLAQQGNHDGWSSGISNYYNSFSKNSTLFMNRTASYLTNDSPSGNSSYMVIQEGNYNYLVISLSCSGSASGSNNNTAWDSSDEAWLKNILNTYTNCPTIVTTHDLQNCSATTPNAITLSTQGKKLWEIVKNYDQVFMMVGGHSHGSGVEMLTNANGKQVISILADYQFSYNGGNGFFKYAEFSEAKNKIFLKTYSPYSASLSTEEKTFFDVNFMTGEGNYNEINLDFANRFAGMEITKATATEGKWMSGEYHAHTNQSNDATVATSKFENILDVAFRESNWTSIAGASNITSGTGFDYFFLADHFRKSIADADGNSYSLTKYTPRYIGIEQQLKKFGQLVAQGKYQNKIFYSGFEWDMPGLDHATVGIINSDSTEVPTDAVHEFEWLYADQNNDPDSLYENSGALESANYGARKATTAGGRNDVSVAYDGIEWLAENYPDSYVLPNHPSRHNGSSSGVVTVENLRFMNDIAPNIVFGFEGMPGNQLSPDGTRCELNDIYGGADVMLAEVGGIWDSMLGEGRHFYTFTNSDFHFKTSGTNSSGYYPSEYSRNYTFVNPGTDNLFDFKDVVEGMRSGNSFAVYGDLIDALDFTATSGDNSTAMGSDLQAVTDDKVNLTIRFKSPSNNNYAEFTDHDTSVTNEVSVDHVDLICGEITGTLDSSEYNKEVNTTTKVIKSFNEEDWGEADADGYYTINYEVTADTSKYYRLRGTNLANGTVGYTDSEGNPLKDIAYTSSSVPDFNTRVNNLNDRNYTGLWFYSNPIFVYASDSNDAALSNINLSTGTLNPAFDSNTKNYTAEVTYEVDSIEVMPTSMNSHSIITVEGIQVTTGAAVALEVGNNEINIIVTAQDGITTSEYILSVIRGTDEGKIPIDPTPEVPDKSISVIGQGETLIAGTEQSITFESITTQIVEGTAVTANWCDEYGNVEQAPTGISISASPVVASGSSITVTTDKNAQAGTYYFKVSSEGVTSDVVVLTITASTGSYIVTFLDWDGSILKTEVVIEGNGAIAPVNPSRAGYTFTGWDKAFNIITDNLTVTAQYRRNVADNDNDNKGSSNSSTGVELVRVEIKYGDTDSTLTQIEIERTTKSNGQKTDTVNFEKESAIVTVNTLKAKKEDTAIIVIPDEKDEVTETLINLPIEAIDVLAAGEINLLLELQEAEIAVSKESLKNINEKLKKDLYFRVVPVKDQTKKEELEKEAVLAVSLVKGSMEESTMVIGNPVTIETNMTSLEADITLPLSGVQIPTDVKEREALFKQLGIYIKHSDGDEELVQGEIKEVSKGVYGICFHIAKFSEFAIVKADAFTKSSECNITNIIAPSRGVIQQNNITATVTNSLSNFTIKVSVSDKAHWELYSDKNCTQIIVNHKLKLKKGTNKAYIKVTAEDGTTKIYNLSITRGKTEK